jgi:dihydrodipicolinate synthase/N-acetylneuraminate lyase
MRTLEETCPRHGLSVPVVTVIDQAGELMEADQRALVRHVVQEGRGADIVFAAGTTGEWDRVSHAVQQRCIQVCAEEVRKLNASVASASPRGVEVWAGITAHTAQETLENLEFAALAGADAAVLAPLSIRDARDVVGFVARNVADLLDALPRRIPVYLYDNADIAVDPRVPHIRTRWNRWLLRDTLPIGVVAGPANVFPREWARAWQVCRAGDPERMEEVREVLEAFRSGTYAAGGRRSIACIKRALRSMGVIASDAVAAGTPELAAPDAERFDRVFEEVLGLARERIGPPWLTVVEGSGAGPAA